MKRANHLFKKFVSIENLRTANEQSRKGKNHYREVAEFQKNLEQNLSDIQTELLLGTYTTGKYRIKNINERGKERKIYVLPYRDRVVQRALGNVIEPVVLRHLTPFTHATIKNRGIHSALKQVTGYLEDIENTQYCLKIDIHHYFPSISHTALKEIWRRIIKDKKILKIIDNIIDSVPEDEGIPIGNYFSQLAANIYLSPFDHWIKEVLKIKYYTRYMDDMVFFSSSPTELRKQFREIDWYLLSRLSLQTKDNWQIFFIDKRVVDFIGYRMSHNNTILRKSTFKRLRRRCLDVAKRVGAENITYTEYCSVNSFKGWSMHGNDETIKEKYYKPIENKLSEFQKINSKPNII